MNTRTAFYIQAIRGPVLLVTVGVLFAIHQAGGLSFSRTWPLLIIVIGIMKLLERAWAPNTPAPNTPWIGSSPVDPRSTAPRFDPRTGRPIDPWPQPQTSPQPGMPPYNAAYQDPHRTAGQPAPPSGVPPQAPGGGQL